MILEVMYINCANFLFSDHRQFNTNLKTLMRIPNICHGWFFLCFEYMFSFIFFLIMLQPACTQRYILLNSHNYLEYYTET